MDVIDLRTAGPDLLAAAAATQAHAQTIADPDLPPIGAAEFTAFVHHDHTDGNRHDRLAALDPDSDPRAVAFVEYESDEANLHFAAAEIFGAAGDPAAGRAALAEVLDRCEADGRTTLAGWGPNLPDEAAFWEGAGGSIRYRERISVLDVTAVDAALMDAWIDARKDRAADIELVRFVGACPDELLDVWVTSRNAMNDAPTDELDVNPWAFDGDDIRTDEASRAALGQQMMTLLALTPDGAPAGHTTVNINTQRPAASEQWDTVVFASQRRRGIGRWLKAEMWRWLREARPDVTRLATGNAQSNDPMLSINVAMGYRPLVEYAAWQADIATYRAGLAATLTS